MLEKVLLEFGYSDTDIIMIKYNKRLSKYEEKELCVRIKDMFIFLMNMGYSKEEVLWMTSNNSSIFDLSKKDIDDKKKLLIDIGYSEEEFYNLIKNNSSIVNMSVEEIRGVINSLIGFGNSFDDVRKMTLKYSHIFNEGNCLIDKFNELVSLGVDKETINFVTKKNPSIYGFRYEEYINKIKYLIEVGFSLGCILKLTKESEYFNILLIDDVKKKIRDFEIIGYNVNDVEKMIMVYPNTIIANLSDVINKIQCFGSFGFYYSESKKMIKENAKLLGHSDEMIKEVRDLFCLYGYEPADINKLLMNYPVIFEMSFLDLVRKLEFLKSIRFSKRVISNPEILFYSIEDMYSRYMYLTSNGVKVNYKNVGVLFVSNDEFCDKYNANYEEVIANYKNNFLLSGYSLRKTKKK